MAKKKIQEGVYNYLFDNYLEKDYSELLPVLQGLGYENPDTFRKCDIYNNISVAVSYFTEGATRASYIELYLYNLVFKSGTQKDAKRLFDVLQLDYNDLETNFLKVGLYLLYNYKRYALLLQQETTTQGITDFNKRLKRISNFLTVLFPGLNIPDAFKPATFKKVACTEKNERTKALYTSDGYSLKYKDFTFFCKKDDRTGYYCATVPALNMFFIYSDSMCKSRDTLKATIQKNYDLLVRILTKNKNRTLQAMDLFNQSLTAAGVSCELVETSHAELLAFYKSLEAPETVTSPAETETVATDEETTATPAEAETTDTTPAETGGLSAEPETATDEPRQAEPVRTSASAAPSYFVACLKVEPVKPADVTRLQSLTLPTFDSLPTFGAFYLSSCVSAKDLQAVGDSSGSFKASGPGKACRYSAILSGLADVAPVNTS